ncbi:coiled-coil domain-containing protein 178 isoform X12 [Heterodontus francisci]|uniref:coiled-coil domain-containing protein 178 isoform X12 n=1 Tax=Heterodontus francisci TaxID=7792 RepID=UPI00355C553B
MEYLLRYEILKQPVSRCSKTWTTSRLGLISEMTEGSCHLGSSAYHNCDFVKISSPFVCKVIRHIRELEAKTELWFRQFTASVHSETQEISQSSENANGNAERYVTPAKNKTMQTLSSDQTSPNLCVKGFGLDGTEHDQTTTLHEQAREVLSEIIDLMKQLEAECQKTNDALKTERERVATLGNKIDQLSLWWLQELPEAVQKEYEVCSQDLSELQWHVEVKAYHLKNLQNQVTDADILNRRLQEEINLMKKLEYQLEEKLDFEQNIINDIVPNQREVKRLKIKYAEKQTAISILTESCSELTQTLKDRTRIGNSELSEQQKELDRKLNELKHLENKNKELELEIEIFNNDIKESRQERNKMKKEIRQIQEALKINNGKLNTMKKQLTQVERTQNAVRAKLLMLTKTLADQEDQLKGEIGKLKKKIKEVMVLRTKLQAKAKQEAEGLVRVKNSANKKKESVLKKVTQAEKIVEDIEVSFKELQARHQNDNETFMTLSKKLNEFEENQQSITENLETEKKDLQKQLTDGQKEYLDSFNQLNDTLRRNERMQEDFLQKQTLKTILLKEIEKYKNSIAELQPVLDVVEFKHSNAANIITKFKTELEMANKRKARMEEEHRKLIRDRKEKRQEVRVKLALALMENANRTEEYQQLQHTYAGTKNKLADIYDDRQKTEVRIKDYLQLSALQTRMHKALVDYSKQRGLYSQAGLAVSQALSRDNAQKIIAVQGEMSKSIQRISAFLQSLADSCETKEDTANKQCNQDGVIKDKKSHAVQITV